MKWRSKAATPTAWPARNLRRPNAISPIPANVAASAGTIAAYVTPHVSVDRHRRQGLCRGHARVAPDGDGVIVRIRFRAAMSAGDLVYRSTVLTATQIRRAPSRAHWRRRKRAAGAARRRATDAVRISAPAPPVWSTMQRYLVTGIEHIFLGYDHIAFLVAIVLWARRLMPVIKMVTAFTIAHSITLSLAALQLVVIPSAIVEPAIAASIVFRGGGEFLLARCR